MGVIWGVNKAGQIYYRAGVTRRLPIGTSWIKIGGRLAVISPGCVGVYGVSTDHKIWRYTGKCLNKLTAVEAFLL